MANILDPKPELLVAEIDNTFIKKNFIALKEFFEQENQLLGFRFFTVKFDKAEKNKKIAHSLSRTPKDIVFTSMSGNQQIDFNLGLFDGQNMDITVSGPCTISFFAGTYWKDSQRTIDAADVVSYGSIVKTSTAENPESDAGIILPFAGYKVPKGYLACNGASYKVSDYPDLAAALLNGTVYVWGGGNGSFNVPDLRGYFLRGAGGVDPDPRVSKGGSADNGVGSYQEYAMKKLTGDTPNGPGQTTPNGIFDPVSVGLIGTGTSYGSHLGRINMAKQSLVSDFECRPVNAAVNYIIKT